MPQYSECMKYDKTCCIFNPANSQYRYQRKKIQIIEDNRAKIVNVNNSKGTVVIFNPKSDHYGTSRRDIARRR